MNKIDVCDSFDDKLPEIYTIGNNEIELESDDLFTESEWSQEPKNENVQETWVNALSVELERVAAVDPRPVGHVRPVDPGKQEFSQGVWRVKER